MRILGSPGAFRHFLSTVLLGAALLPASGFAVSAPGGMVALEDDEMADVSGAGLAFAMDNFHMRFAPTSYIELTGTEPQGDASWLRGDARYYGLSITSGDPSSGTTWYGSSCDTNGIGGALACPLGVGGVTALASPFDPYVLRVFQYDGHDYSGVYHQGDTRPTILELVGPSSTDLWRWSFWGQLEVGRPNPYVSLEGTENNARVGTGGADFLQSQTIIHGRPVTAGRGGDREVRPAILRLMRTTGMGVGEDSFGITYQSALSGDFRFSVRQRAGSSLDQLHTVPDFDDAEGMYFKNVDAFLPLGVLHYQAITFDSVRENDGSGLDLGNFIVELTRIPNIPEIYNHFYCGEVNNSNPNGCALAPDGSIDTPNESTRGYVHWGNFDGVNTATGEGLPGANNRENGIYFVGGGDPNSGPPLNEITNIGISRIEGMRIHHLKITTLGAGQ